MPTRPLPRARRRRWISLAVAAVLTAAAPVLGVALPAQAAPAPLPAQVLRILDGAGAPIDGAVVSLQTAPFEPEVRAVTNSSGTIDLTTLPGLQVGVAYELFVWANGFANYWDNAPVGPDSQPVVPTVGAPQLDVNTQTTNPPPSATVGGISGTVTDALTGAPVPGVLLNANIAQAGTGSGDSQTRNDGSFYVGFTASPMPNSAILTFLPLVTSPAAPYGYGIQDYDAVFPWQNRGSTVIPIDPNATTTGINAQLVPNGRLTGRVTAVSGSSVVPADADVSTVDPTTGFEVASGSTDSAGNYAFPTAPGTWLVKIEQIVNGNVVATQYYDGATTAAAGTPVTVTATRSTDGIDAQFGTLPAPSPTPRPAVLPVTGAPDALLPAGLGAIALVLGAAVLLTARDRARRSGR